MGSSPLERFWLKQQQNDLAPFASRVTLLWLVPLVSVLGLLLSLAGLGLLVLTGIRTASTLLASEFWPLAPAYYTDAVPSTLQPAWP